MAALTPATGYPIRDSVGSLTLLTVQFASVTGADTWSSGLGSNVIGYWANTEGNVGTTTTGIGANVVYVASTGIFTFAVGTAATLTTLFVVLRG